MEQPGRYEVIHSYRTSEIIYDNYQFQQEWLTFPEHLSPASIFLFFVLFCFILFFVFILVYFPFDFVGVLRNLQIYVQFQIILYFLSVPFLLIITQFFDTWLLVTPLVSSFQLFFPGSSKINTQINTTLSAQFQYQKSKWQTENMSSI